LALRALSAAPHALAGSVPFVGPAALHAGEQIGSGDVAGGLGSAAGVLAPLVAGKAAPALADVAGKAAPALADAIPSKARAGANFEKVLRGAGQQPIDVSHIQPIRARAGELSTRGGSNLPKVFSDFDANPPKTYAEGRDFASNSGSLSVADTMSNTASMLRQIQAFAKAMDEANQTAARTAGLEEPYLKAMTEYRRAKQLEAITDFAKQHAAKAGALGGLGYAAYKKVTDK
jgi:hypothetical protein